MDFDKREKEIQAQELEEWQQGQIIKNENYADEVRSAGYDTTHEYEAAIESKLIRRFMLIIGVGVTLLLVL